MVKTAVALRIPEINVLLRPRPGDFVYSNREIDAIVADAETLHESGATGVVFGALLADGSIDRNAVNQVLKLSRRFSSDGKKCHFTFHRAVDLCRDWRQAFDFIIAEGIDCVLTSGQNASAFEGIEVLTEMVEYADGRINVMAGAGVNPRNAREIICTGVDQIHSTARLPVRSPMDFRRVGVPMGVAGMDEYSRLETSEAIVSQLIEITKDFESYK